MTNAGLFSVDEAMAHLRRADAVLWRLIEQAGPYDPPRDREDPYASLLRTILFQQLAGAAARTIQRRWLALYGIEAPTGDGAPLKAPSPEQILATTEDEFRGAGVSRQKAGYMRDLALHVLDGRLDLAALTGLDDTAVVERLTAVKGLGEWSAHMFLMFHMGRPDVLPTGDLGLRHGMRIAYGLAELPTPSRAREIGAPWAPFRSVGSWYMWHTNDAPAG